MNAFHQGAVMRAFVSLIAAGVLLLSGCSGREPTREETAAVPEFRLNATIRDIMDSFVDPAADHIWDAVSITVTAKRREEKYPRTDEEWKELRRRAIQIMEAANLLLVPGRRVARPGENVDPRIALPPDQIEALINQDRAGFTKMAHDLYDSVLPTLQAIEAKDKDKLLEVSDGIYRACENCHSKYWYAKR
ncbi:MAG: hypothetical protein ACR2L6_02775 [Gemmatimonadaceae bacterium]